MREGLRCLQHVNQLVSDETAWFRKETWNNVVSYIIQLEGKNTDVVGAQLTEYLKGCDGKITKWRNIWKNTEQDATAQWTENQTSYDETIKIILSKLGRDSSVGVATRYRPNGQGTESRWGRAFPDPSRPALGPNQPPIQRSFTRIK